MSLKINLRQINFQSGVSPPRIAKPCFPASSISFGFDASKMFFLQKLSTALANESANSNYHFENKPKLKAEDKTARIEYFSVNLRTFNFTSFIGYES